MCIHQHMIPDAHPEASYACTTSVNESPPQAAGSFFLVGFGLGFGVGLGLGFGAGFGAGFRIGLAGPDVRIAELRAWLQQNCMYWHS
jgi:hypothetical protein